MKRIAAFLMVLGMSLLGQTVPASAAEDGTYLTVDVTFVGFSATSGYWFQYGSSSNASPAAITCEGNRISFDKYVNGSGVLTSFTADQRNTLQSLLLAANLSGRKVRVNLSKNNGVCYTRQVFLYD